MRYFKTTNRILKEDDKLYVYNPKTKSWEYDFYWDNKIYYSDFIDYEEISEEEALKLLS